MECVGSNQHEIEGGDLWKEKDHRKKQEVRCADQGQKDLATKKGRSQKREVFEKAVHSEFAKEWNCREEQWEELEED